MLRKTLAGLATAVAVSTLFSGCAVGPDYQRPAAPSAAGYAPTPPPESTAAAPVAAGEAQHFAASQDVPFDWWKAFQSPALNALVEKVLRANPTIDQAKSALRQAQENVAAQQGYFYPTIGAQWQSERQMLAGNTGGNSPGIQGNGKVIQTKSNPAGPKFNGPVTFNMHTAQLTVSFTPDVFGLNLRQVESLQAQAEIQRYEMEATYVTLATNMVAAGIQEASVRRQIAAAREIIGENEKSLALLQKQFQLGYVMGIDVAAQESALAAAQALLPPLELQLEQTRDLIRALVGNLPNEDVAETFDFDSLRLPTDLPLTVPSRLVDQRPDIRAAEEQIRAANAQVGIAIANRLPGFSLSGAVGGIASEAGQVFSPGGPFWNIIGSVTQTMFDGGTLRHRQRAADEGLFQAASQYRSTVLAAYQDVADTLHALHSDAEALAVALKAEQAAKKTLDLTRVQSDKGYVSSLVLLQAEQAYQQALLALVQAQASRFGDTAAFYMALGGGWWNRETAVTASN